MDSIISFFEGIGDAISTLLGFWSAMWQDLFWLIKALIWALGKLPSYLSWIPPGYSVLILGTLAIVVIYKILGREG